MNPTTSENGLVHVISPYSVAETTKRLLSVLETKGIQLFCHIDHSGEAKKAGLEMPPTQLLIFGNPKGGTPLMLAQPTVAIDLPLKVLVWEDEAEEVWVTYNSPGYLEERHHLTQELIQNIAVIGGLVGPVVAA